MSLARVHWIGGPVLRARPDGPFMLREAVEVGPRRLRGEVIRVARSEIVVQVYEETSGLRPGSELRGTGQPLSIELGPGLLGGIFDGLLRPIDRLGPGPFVEPGMPEQSSIPFPFLPKVAIGQRLQAGEVFGSLDVGEMPGGALLVPPLMPTGRVTEIAPAGDYLPDQPLCRLQTETGEEHELSMVQRWPVRLPRPVAERLQADEPLVTGQRILDCLFPIARGGTAAIPGGFGTGKTVLLETLAKWSDVEVIVYVGCGERGNEMAGLLQEFSRLEDPHSGRLLGERTVIIANTSNMPVSAREASIYTGVTVAEFFRDQGLHVALMADSTSRWAEALREISGRLGELPGEGGYPAYLGSRLADFYERAARVRTLAGATASVTLMGAVSPPSGDFSEPVTNHSRRYVGSLWALDPQRAQARFYPAVNPLLSYSLVAPGLARWWQLQGCTRWQELRRLFLSLLEDATRLERMARIIGRDAMPEAQRLTLLCAEMVNEAFLRQSAFATNERYVSPARQAVMMRLLGSFIERAQKVVERGISPEMIARVGSYRALVRMGEEIAEGEWERFSDLEQRLEKDFRTLVQEPEMAMIRAAGP